MSGIIENMTELRSEVAQDAVQQGILAWLLKRMKVRRHYNVITY